MNSDLVREELNHIQGWTKKQSRDGLKNNLILNASKSNHMIIQKLKSNQVSLS